MTNAEKFYDAVMRLPIVAYQLFLILRELSAIRRLVGLHPYFGGDWPFLITMAARVAGVIFISAILLLSISRLRPVGKYTWSPRGPSAGESYSGDYLNDRRHGYGVYEWRSGDRYAGLWADDAITGMPTPMMIARARANTEALAAVGKPGAKVCRVLRVGIAVRDWIRGEVTAVDRDRIVVRIDDPGRQPHVLDGQPLVKGMTIRSAATEWTPCV